MNSNNSTLTARIWRIDWNGVCYRFSRHPQMLVGLAIIVVMVFTMIFAPWIAPYTPSKLDLLNRLAPPSAAHWFGTDQIGRDIFSRVVYGSRISVTVGLGVVIVPQAYLVFRGRHGRNSSLFKLRVLNDGQA